MKGKFCQSLDQNIKVKTWSFVLLFLSLVCVGSIFSAINTQMRKLNDLQHSITKELERIQKTREGYQHEMDIANRHKREARNDIDVDFNDTGIKQVYIKNTQNNAGGAVYTRWGRTNCSSGAQLVYEGVVGGGAYDHGGSATNALCLTRNPKWNNYRDGVQSSAFIYGAEYQTTANSFSSKNVVQLLDANVPCAVCLNNMRKNSLMIPGTNECTSGWHLEYQGYLMAGAHDQPSATEYICMDEAPESSESGYRNEDGKLFYVVEARCGALPCPEYVEGREVTCAVCTK